MSLLARAVLWKQPPLDRMSILERTVLLEDLPSSRIAVPSQTTRLYHQTQSYHHSASTLDHQENTRMNYQNAHRSCMRTRQKTITLNSYLKIKCIIKYHQQHQRDNYSRVFSGACCYFGLHSVFQGNPPRNMPRQLRMIPIWSKRISLLTPHY